MADVPPPPPPPRKHSNRQLANNSDPPADSSSSVSIFARAEIVATCRPMLPTPLAWFASGDIRFLPWGEVPNFRYLTPRLEDRGEAGMDVLVPVQRRRRRVVAKIGTCLSTAAQSRPARRQLLLPGWHASKFQRPRAVFQHSWPRSGAVVSQVKCQVHIVCWVGQRMSDDK